MVVEGIEMANPLGAVMFKTKLDEPQPTSVLKTLTAYLSCWPGKPHDPREAQAHVLSIEARGAFCVHPGLDDPLSGFPAANVAGTTTMARARATMDRPRATLGVMCGFLSLDSLRAVNALQFVRGFVAAWTTLARHSRAPHAAVERGPQTPRS